MSIVSVVYLYNYWYSRAKKWRVAEIQDLSLFSHVNFLL